LDVQTFNVDIGNIGHRATALTKTELEERPEPCELVLTVWVEIEIDHIHACIKHVSHHVLHAERLLQQHTITPTLLTRQLRQSTFNQQPELTAIAADTTAPLFTVWLVNLALPTLGAFLGNKQRQSSAFVWLAGDY